MTHGNSISGCRLDKSDEAADDLRTLQFEAVDCFKGLENPSVKTTEIDKAFRQKVEIPRTAKKGACLANTLLTFLALVRD